MSNVVGLFNKTDVANVLEAYVSGVPYYCELYYSNDEHIFDIFDDPSLLEKMQEAVDAVKYTFDKFDKEISQKSFQAIQRYMWRYKISARGGIDEYKLIYFFGKSISEVMTREALGDASKVIQYASVIMLDACLKEHTGDGGRTELRSRLKKLIKLSEVHEQLGETGMYLTYKVASNVLKDAGK